eukprot:gnl/MRDRNA2_/MRDRNA2_74908_c0_seq1.p1 gnl/MRDRNA2_/MRDRNA2_74908_c0~~gnl/MRDRNA2_/MRDRNA2_74908_c0_seq1.p1  ORF type:complete len:554 (+),score=127.52 gnl/MRDRNA2_/MRDRNA2_74908_c0_seq1:192-1853(+)
MDENMEVVVVGEERNCETVQDIGRRANCEENDQEQECASGPSPAASMKVDILSHGSRNGKDGPKEQRAEECIASDESAFHLTKTGAEWLPSWLVEGSTSVGQVPLQSKQMVERGQAQPELKGKRITPPDQTSSCLQETPKKFQGHSDLDVKPFDLSVKEDELTLSDEVSIGMAEAAAEWLPAWLVTGSQHTQKNPKRSRSTPGRVRSTSSARPNKNKAELGAADATVDWLPSWLSNISTGITPLPWTSFPSFHASEEDVIRSDEQQECKGNDRTESNTSTKWVDVLASSFSLNGSEKEEVTGQSDFKQGCKMKEQTASNGTRSGREETASGWLPSLPPRLVKLDIEPHASLPPTADGQVTTSPDEDVSGLAEAAAEWLPTWLIGGRMQNSPKRSRSVPGRIRNASSALSNEVATPNDLSFGLAETAANWLLPSRWVAKGMDDRSASSIAHNERKSRAAPSPDIVRSGLEGMPVKTALPHPVQSKKEQPPVLHHAWEPYLNSERARGGLEATSFERPRPSNSYRDPQIENMLLKLEQMNVRSAKLRRQLCSHAS